MGVFVGTTVNACSPVDVTTDPVSVTVVTSEPLTSGDVLYAYHPYSEANATSGPTDVKLTFPAVQSYSGTLFDADAMPMVSLPCEVTHTTEPGGSHSTGDVLMCNLGSVVEFGIQETS